MTQYGLTTEKALKKLKEAIKNQLCCCLQRNKSMLWLPRKLFNADSTLHFSIIGCGGIFLVLIAILANLFAFHMDSYTTLLAEFVILLVFFLGILLFCIREVILKENEIERTIGCLLSEIDETVTWSDNQYPSLTLPDSRSFTLVWTYRDGHVVNLPWNLVVEGDVIILGSGAVALTRCKEIQTDDTSGPLHILEAGDTFNPASLNNKECDPFPRQRFEVMQTPVETLISSYFHENSHKLVSICNADAKIIRQFIERRLLFAVVLFVLLVNIIRWRLIPEASGFNLEMIFLIPCHSIFPLLPLTFPIIWKFVSFYGAARLRVLLSIYSKLYTKASDSEEIILEHVDRLAVWKSFWKILCGDPQGLPRRIDLVHALGSITTFSCVDKEGILCYPNPIPEKLFYFESMPTTSQINEGNINSADVPVCVSSQLERSFDEVKILTISSDPQSCNGFRFDELEWQKSISSLKPLGLNMLLNSPCLYPLKTIRENDFINQLLLASNNSLMSGLNGCLCGLSREIGFKDLALHNYQHKQKIFTYSPMDSTEATVPSSFYLSIVREKRLPHMISSLINQTNSNITQMLSVGSADIILEACSDIWNGCDIKPLSEAKKEKALSFFQRMDITGRCLAYSYRPVFENVTVNDHSFVQFSNKRWNSVELQVSNKVYTDSEMCEIKSVQEDLCCEDLLKKPVFNSSTCQLDKQIFLGMVTLTHLLKEDVLTLVEQLNVAGIRFVHFSYDNELLSRVFCQRLGLETGWNCHISLSDDNDYIEYSSSAISDSCPFLYQEDVEGFNRSFRRRENESSLGSFRRREPYSSASLLAKGESQDEDLPPKNHYAEFDELYFMTNRSKLPKGIQCMRAHLEEVDDVPLLVPLFTDCTPQAVCDMINIMQDYDDIVCCIGSSLNLQNHTIFSSADVSISVNPILRNVCTTKDQKINDCYELHRSDLCLWTTNKYRGPLELSSLLNSVSCSLRLTREENFPISALLCESRRILFGLRSCFLFLVYCHLFLTILQLLSTCFLLPPPLSGLQMLWLICIIIPLLSISLIGTPNNGKLMKVITGKRKKHSYKEFASSYVKQFFVTFGLNAFLITTGLFPWLLTMFCKRSNAKTRCSWFLGARNASLSMGGYYDELKDGYHAAQDVILCYITISFTLLSSSFVHRSDFLWRKSPFKNKPWCVCILASLLLQAVLTLIFDYSHDLAAISPFFYLVCFVVLFVVILLSEAYKGCLKRKSVRLQKRERLKFDTKLGMNSPI
ncbi:transmembrane protein 94 isoform X2 [Hydra vulgaris]|uniref:transmembrane protein 94 isoform X2 n=1 Tax=Hydra vulgaris TaxID=6087 RepID=UPI001F5F0561|nr:transmembrane protein 94 isoform X2 [Hydra vulgaris]